VAHILAQRVASYWAGVWDLEPVDQWAAASLFQAARLGLPVAASAVALVPGESQLVSAVVPAALAAPCYLCLDRPHSVAMEEGSALSLNKLH
jgi:hypothetical protein